MANRRIEVDIIANDRASNVFASVRSAGSNMASTLITTLGSTVNVIGGLDNALRTYNASMYRFNRVVYSAVRMAGGAIANFTKDAISNYTELERQHAKTMGAMATEYGKTTEAQAKFLNDSEKLKQQAIKLGTYGPNGNGSLFTIPDVSYAQTSLIKSGMSADNILNSDAIESVLKFAGGNDLDIDTATQFAVNLATVFDTPVERWGNMLDMVTKAADISVIDVEDIMDSLTYTGGIASGLGRDLSEVLGVISVMGQAGLRGRVAGTGMSAFFTRILSAGELSDTSIDKAPSNYVGQMYNAFIEEAVDQNGKFKDMDEIAELLDTAMSELSDQEQAWFAKKLFGLYQMKAAYAISGSVDEGGNLITDYIDQIENQSKGTNDIKYELMQGSQYGKIESLKNAWEGAKVDVGERLSPIVSTISDELFNFLKNDGNYDIDWTRLREAISESGALISEKYGESIGQAVEGLGNFGIDAALITDAISPEIGGIFNGIIKLFNGDISGALDDFSSGIEKTNDNIDGLPEDLRGTANAAKNVITVFTALSGINIATQIAQVFTSAINLFLLKPIKFIKSLITSTSTQVSTTQSTINSTSTTVNSTNTTINISNATAVNIAKVPLMNVTASIVNVYGGGINGDNGNGGDITGGSPTLPSGGSPILPGGGGILILPGLPNGGTLGLPSGSPTLPGGGGTLALPGGAIVGAGAATGKTISLYYNPLTGTYTTAGNIAGSVAAIGTKLAGIAAASYIAASIPTENQLKTSYQYGFGTDYANYLGEDYMKVQSIPEFFHDTFGIPAGKWRNDMTNYKVEEFMDNEVKPATPDNYRNARDEFFDSIDGFKDYAAGREYISGMLDRWYWENSNGNKNFITEDQYVALAAALVEAMDLYMQENNITEVESNDLGGPNAESIPGYGTDIYANVLSKALSGIINEVFNNVNYNNGNINQTGVGTTSGTSSQSEWWKNAIGSDVVQRIVGPISNAADRLKSPNVNVYVTNNIDKNGNVKTTVDLGKIAEGVSRRSAQYGSTVIVN